MVRIKYSSLAIILFFTSAFLFALFLIPKYQALSKLKISLSEYKKVLAEQEDYFRKVDEDLEKLKDYEDPIKKIYSASPKQLSTTTINLFNLIDNLASAAGLPIKDIKSFTISESKEISNLKETEISFIVSGPYSFLKGFVSNLENSARLIKIEEISFKTEGQITKTPVERIFDFSFKIKAYSF